MMILLEDIGSRSLAAVLLFRICYERKKLLFYKKKLLKTKKLELKLC